MSLQRVARLGDAGSHGGVIIVPCSPTRTADGIAVARVTDLYACALHGPNKIMTGSVCVTADGLKVARITDTTECGAQIIEGSPTWSSE